MTEEIERLKSDLKHTSSARARAESREDEVRSSLTTAEGELREVRGVDPKKKCFFFIVFF